MLFRSEKPDAPPVPRELTDAERKSIESELRKETDALVRDDERYTEESVERLQEAWSKFKEIKPREVIADELASLIYPELRQLARLPHSLLPEVSHVVATSSPQLSIGPVPDSVFC